MEGRKLEVEEESMTGWCQVRRKGGQEEKVVSAVSRGWEEYKRTFPHLAHEQRHLRASEWKELLRVKAWLKNREAQRENLEDRERRLEKKASGAQKREVEKWLRGGGGLEGGDVLSR